MAECRFIAPDAAKPDDLRCAACGHTVAHSPDKPRYRRFCHVAKKRPRELSQVDCLHLVEIREGYAKACCGGEGLVDLGVCHLLGKCTLNGIVVDGVKTTSCVQCKYQEPKG